MNPFYRDKWMWAMVLELTRNHDFHIVEIPEQESPQDGTEEQTTSIYLLRNEGRKYHMIRLHAVNYMWGSKLIRDIRLLADQAPVFRRRLKASSLSIYNFFLFPIPRQDYLNESLESIELIQEQTYSITTNVIYVPEDEPFQFLDEAAWGTEEIGINQRELISHTQQHFQYLSYEQLHMEIRKEERRKEEHFKQSFYYGKPIFTFLFLLVNTILFVMMEWNGSSTDPETLIRFGAKYTPAIDAGEYWRFVTPMFLHIGFVHIFLNNLALYFLGSIVERIYGSTRFFLMYILAGVAGIVASYLFTPHLAAGASGAIFGCFGAMLYFGLRRPNLFFRTLGNDIILILLLNLGIGFLFPMIDNYGHIGGLVGGFVMCLLLGLPPTRSKTT